MTTPHQLPPDGAYVIDEGGGEYNYGQGLNDQSAANLMVAGFPSISLLNPLEAVGEAISVVTNTLLSLPLEVLQLFEQLIPGDLGDAFTTVAGAVGAIVGQISAIGPLFGSVAFSALDTAVSLLSTVVSQVMDIFNGLIVTPINTVVQGVLDWWNLLTGQTAANTAAAANAQASADNANVGVAQIAAQLAAGSVPGGVLIFDTFDRSGSTLGSDYTQSYYGGPAGTLGTDGNNAVVAVSGGSDRGCVALHNTALSTIYNACAFVTNGVFPSIVNPTALFLIIRSNPTLTYRIYAEITNSAAAIHMVVSGVDTSLASASVTPAAGDRWTLKAGTDVALGGDDREFILYQNSNPIITVTDTSGTSQMGVGYDQPGFVEYANTQFLPPFFTIQTAPPGLQSFTAYDRPAAA